MKNPIPLFLIPLVETAGVNASRSSDKQFAQFVKKSLGRYFLQDWGEMCEEDKKANNWSLTMMRGSWHHIQIKRMTIRSGSSRKRTEALRRFCFQTNIKNGEVVHVWSRTTKLSRIYLSW